MSDRNERETTPLPKWPRVPLPTRPSTAAWAGTRWAGPANRQVRPRPPLPSLDSGLVRFQRRSRPRAEAAWCSPLPARWAVGWGWPRGASGAQGCGSGPWRGQRWRGLRGPVGLFPEPAAPPRPGQPPPLQPRPGPSLPRAAEAGESLPGPAASFLGVGPRRGLPPYPISCFYVCLGWAEVWMNSFGGPR